MPHGWARVRFGDVAFRVTESLRPTPEQSRHYIGLEHMRSDSYLITKWGSEVDLDVPKTPVLQGDVLFARRNTHLRRCAVAPFDTIFSPDGYAIRAKDPTILRQDFLLHLVSSDAFMDFAVENSAGTHSKRVKWSALERYEFALPPVTEQQRVAELLGAVADLQAASEALLVKLDAAVTAVAHSAWTPLDDQSLQPEMVPLRELAGLKRGRFSHRPRNEPRLYDSGGPYPFVQTGDVQNADRYLTQFSQFLSQEGTTYSRCVPAGTLLVTIAAVIGATAWTTAPTYLPDSIVSLEPRAGVSGGYLELLLRALRRKLENEVATENTQKNLSVELLGSVLVPRLGGAAQDVLVSRAEAIWATMSAARIESERVRVLATTLRESLLSEGI